MLPVRMRRASRNRSGSPAVCYKGRVEREFSAGGVLVRRLRGRWWVAAIRPNGKPEGTWALPKGLIARGEDPAAFLRSLAHANGTRLR